MENKMELIKSLMEQIAITEANNTPIIWSVFIPANVYAGKYYEIKTIRVYVLAQDKKEAAKLINSNKKVVIEHITKKRISGKPAVPAKNPEKNIFFKSQYNAEPATVTGNNVQVLTTSGFKPMKIEHGKLV